MKVNVVYNTTDMPYGGGNQFLKALKDYFSGLGLLTSEDQADVFLFNSHHNIDRVSQLKHKFPEKVFIHRIDGPIRLYNNMSDNRDLVVYEANNDIADGTVFQSEWSKEANLKLGMRVEKPSAVIPNGIDNKIFYPNENKTLTKKIRIISTSFSSNLKKGFNTYRFLDDNLDFDRFEYCFAGNSPVSFKNIKNIGCLTSKQLADKLRNSDIFVTASQKDPCSNSLIEAISCGLSVLALDDGGHTELLENPGCMFSSQEQLLEIIKKEDFKKSNNGYLIEDSAQKYLSFFKELAT
jgi:glycosyltransferase involved in cell wall biosynthesis